MKEDLIRLLRSKAEAKRASALYTLKLYALYPAGVGEHSTGDLYKDVYSAYQAYCESFDEMERLGDLERDFDGI